MDSIAGLNSSYINSMIENTSSGLSSSDLSSKLEALKGSEKSDNTSKSDEKLLEVCREFEAYFLEQMLKEMEKTIPKEEFTSSYASSLYDYTSEGLMKEYASMTAEQGSLGLAKSLYEQLRVQNGQKSLSKINTEVK